MTLSATNRGPLAGALLGLLVLSSACEPNAKVSAGFTTVEIQPNGCVADMWADPSSRINSPDVIRRRAERHINGEIKPSQINTALMTAVVRDQIDVVETLLAARADIEETNEMGCTALIWSAALERTDILDRLVAAGADVSHRDSAGRTPLMFAVRTGDPAIVQKLIAAGADVNAAQTGGINEIGKTALHRAATRKRNLDVVKVLVNAGADIDVEDEHGKTALDVAKWFEAMSGERADVIAYLESQK